jgi:hypothetical protein
MGWVPQTRLLTFYPDGYVKKTDKYVCGTPRPDNASIMRNEAVVPDRTLATAKLHTGKHEYVAAGP